MTFQEWLEQKYTEWEQLQSSHQSYYLFARYLDVNHTTLTQWASGVSLPAGDDLAKLAARLGEEVYGIVGVQPPTAPMPGLLASLSRLPAALRTRLVNAVQETEHEITSRGLDPESNEAKFTAVRIFEKWGFRITG